MRLILYWTALLGAMSLGNAARILAVLPFACRSHFMFFSPILKALAQRGHQVVEYSYLPPDHHTPNYTHHLIDTMSATTSYGLTYDDFIDTFDVMQQKAKFLGVRLKMIGFNTKKKVCETAFKTEQLKNLLSSNEKFDLVMTESTFGQESMNVFGHKFGAPVIALQTLHADASINLPAGNALSIATIPFTNSEMSDKMSFLERLCNFLSATMLLIAYYNYHLPTQEKIIHKYYGQDTPSIEEMVTNISLVLLNVHPTVQYGQPFPPNIILVGGVAISTERAQLPEDIQSFMDTAEEGVIYFSLGTVVPVHIFPKNIIDIFLNVFSKLKYKVLWKIDTKNFTVSLPKNVKTTKWVPQLGVLTHPKCVLFVTHAGLLGQQEAIYAGIPTVAIPFYGDQFYNAKFMEEKEIGIKLYFKDLSEELFYSAITNVINNSTYKENAVRMSHIFKDQPLRPVDTATFWVEYVIRHRGAPQLRPAAAYLRWYQLALLDIAAAVIIAVILVAGLLCYIGAKIISSLFVKVKATNMEKKEN